LHKAGHNQLRHALTDLTAASAMYPSRIDTLNLLANPLKGSDYDGNAPSGIGDPTPAQAFTLDRWHRMQEDIALAVHEVRVHSAILVQLLNRVPSDVDPRRLAELHRCSGGVIDSKGKPCLDPWTRPECTNIVGEQSTTGLCDACRQRRDHWLRRQAELEGAA